MKRAILLSISLYQDGLSPFIPSSCRYTPSCSRYSQQAVEQYGAMKGVWMGVKRLARCHPWGGQGYDPVP